MVKKDLYHWWKKIKSGGQLLGDDYWMDEVKKAVYEFSTEMDIKYDLLSIPNKDYKIFRFFKN
jgi:hypothetical protein